MNTTISTYEKSLYTQLTNFVNNNKYKYILADEKFLVLVPNDNEKAKCLKKDDKNWDCRLFDRNEVLKIFNLNDEENEIDEETSDDDNNKVDDETSGDDNNKVDVVKINGILIILCVTKYQNKINLIK